MSLVFRNGTAADLPAVGRIIAHSFPSIGASPVEWETILAESPHGGVETLWVGDDRGRVVAACRLLRFNQWVGGRTIPIMGLSTVAISATDRRRGLAARLTATGLRESRRRGDIATALYPFRDSFYRKLGYGLAGEVQQFVVAPSLLPDSDERSRVSLVTLADERPALSAVYDAWVPAQTGQFQRSERAWERIWEGGGRHGVIYHDDEGNARGYATFRYLDAPVGGKRTVDVEEIIWLDRRARLGLYGWFASLGDQWGHILYRAHPDENFSEHLAEHRMPLDGLPPWHHWFPASVTLYGPMFRLLDVAEAWRNRTVRPGRSTRLALEVQDEHVAENDGPWTLDLNDGRIEVSAGSRPADVLISTGIETLSRIYIGAISPSAAVAAGLAAADRPDRLPDIDALLALPRPWTYDRF